MFDRKIHDLDLYGDLSRWARVPGDDEEILRATDASVAVNPPVYARSDCVTGIGCIMGYSMVTMVANCRLRYTEWIHYTPPRAPSWRWKPDTTPYATELYNHSNDDEENFNIFPAREGGALAKLLRERLNRGWEDNFVDERRAARSRSSSRSK